MDPRSLGTILLLMIALVNAGKSRKPLSFHNFFFLSSLIFSFAQPQNLGKQGTFVKLPAL